MRTATAFLVLLVLACTPSMYAPARPASPPPEPSVFAFQSNLWINLHHFLRAVARGMPTSAGLAPAEREVWDAAVARYRVYAERHVHFDDGMIAIKTALRAVSNEDPPPEVPQEPELNDLLQSVAPIYRKHWWPAHDALNRSWIAAAQPLVERYGRTIAARAAGAYGQSWPEGPIPVDVTVIGGPVGAYTTTDPIHVIMPSADRGYLGLAGLEMLFHEPSHAWGRELQRLVHEAAEKHQKEVPSQLWHAVLFYNAGEITRRTLAEDGLGMYREYAVEHGVYKNLCGDGCRELVAEHWNRRLAGAVSMEQAIADLVTAWPAATRPDPPAGMGAGTAPG